MLFLFTGLNFVMESICNFVEESSSPTEDEMKTNETALPESRSRASKLESQTSSKVASDRGSGSSNETDAPGSSNAEEKKYKCLQCPKQYKYKKHLSSHMRIHHKNERIDREICDDQRFSTQRNKHMLSHTGEKQHKCSTCNRWFARLGNLKKHQYLHLEKKTFKCPECHVDKYFQTPEQRSYHMLVQHKEKQHECSTCHKEFHRKSDLKHHQLAVHTKLKAFQCGMCEKKFSQSGNLTVHIRSHLGEKPYKCEICGTGFTNSSKRKRHQKNCAHRMEKRQHKCLKCPKRYSNKGHLTRHMKTHNKETTN